MENPKLRIESDGEKTEVYINGEKVNNGFYIHFEHNVREAGKASCHIGKYITDENGIVQLNENKTEPLMDMEQIF